MVKELGVKNSAKKSHSRTAIGRLILPVLGLGMVTEYLWSTKSVRVKLGSIAEQYRQATAVLPVNNASGLVDNESRHLGSNHTQPQQQGLADTALASLPSEASLSSSQSVNAIPIQNMSVIQYNGCCGLGHRLSRQFNAYHAAHKLGFKLNIYWPGCGMLHLNIFDELFAPETAEDLAYVNSTHEYYRVGNEVPGFAFGPKPENCIQSEFDSGYSMYSSMMKRYKPRASLEAFMDQHFKGRFSIGIHIRAGNGEEGDFKNKARHVTVFPEKYVERVSKNILDLVHRSNNTLPPVLFVATDTAQYLDLFQKEMEGKMPVVHWQQERAATGTGVFAGQWQKRMPQDECVDQWSAMLSDMMLLSSTDLVIAGQYSSFSQTMPISIVFGNHPSSTQDRFCEVDRFTMAFTCFPTRMDWCLNTQQKRFVSSLGPNDWRWEKFLKEMYASQTYSKKFK